MLTKVFWGSILLQVPSVFAFAKRNIWATSELESARMAIFESMDSISMSYHLFHGSAAGPWTAILYDYLIERA